MASTIWEFFGYRADDRSDVARRIAANKICPFIGERCEKTFNDGVISGVCSIQPMTSGPVICCPIRMYASGYKVLQDVADMAFGPGHELIPGRKAAGHAVEYNRPCVAVFGQRWGGELRLPQKSGRGGYFVDWILARLDSSGDLVEFVAVEVQTIDTTGSYRSGYESLVREGLGAKTSAGLNWENVSKRILPQLIYKGQVLQRENLCRKGLFFICPHPVFNRIMARLGGEKGLIRYPLQPASITFMVYDHDDACAPAENEPVPLTQTVSHSTTVYKVQEAFNNVTLPEENVYQTAILKALGKGSREA